MVQVHYYYHNEEDKHSVGTQNIKTMLDNIMRNTNTIFNGVRIFRGNKELVKPPYTGRLSYMCDCVQGCMYAYVCLAMWVFASKARLLFIRLSFSLPFRCAALNLWFDVLNVNPPHNKNV